MNSLRNRIAALLIVAIVTVVGLATFAASNTLRPPHPEATIEPLARQLAVAVTLAEREPDALPQGFSVIAEPSTEMFDDRMSHLLEMAFARIDLPKTVVVTRKPGEPAPTAAMALENGKWLVTQVPDMGPPPGGWKTFSMWMGLVILGSTVVSIFAATKITRPLLLLERTAAQIGPDGALPHVPEIGSEEVRATARALNRLSTRLKDAVESRMRLVAAAGHDLRTPMTRMRLRAEFIEDDEERAKWLADLTDLDTIADSAIQLVREEVSPRAETRIDMRGLAEEIVIELRDMGHGTAIRFDGAGDALVVKAAPVALKRALRNLAHNAVTHGKKAQVSIREEDGAAVLTIADEGPGIPNELIGRVFEPFFRVDLARRKSIPGAGLGLAIAKEIIERSGGTISITNRRPNGLVQTVTLPLSPQSDRSSLPL